MNYPLYLYNHACHWFGLHKTRLKQVCPFRAYLLMSCTWLGIIGDCFLGHNSNLSWMFIIHFNCKLYVIIHFIVNCMLSFYTQPRCLSFIISLLIVCYHSVLSLDVYHSLFHCKLYVIILYSASMFIIHYFIVTCMLSFCTQPGCLSFFV